jgi:hypothetical protein
VQRFESVQLLAWDPGTCHFSFFVVPLVPMKMHDHLQAFVKLEAKVGALG